MVSSFQDIRGWFTFAVNQPPHDSHVGSADGRVCVQHPQAPQGRHDFQSCQCGAIVDYGNLLPEQIILLPTCRVEQQSVVFFNHPIDVRFRAFT